MRGRLRRRAAGILLLALAAAPLCLRGASFKANSLGQNIEALDGPSIYRVEDASPEGAAMPPVPGLGGEGFEASSSVLLKEGAPWRRRDSFAKGDLRVEAVWDGARENLLGVRCYDGGRLTYSESRGASTQLVYDGEGRLLLALHRRDGKLESTDFHYRGPDGRLAMVRTARLSGSEDVLISDTFLLEEGRLLTPETVLDLQKEAASARREEGMLVFSSVSPGGVATETTLDEKGQVARIVRKSGGATLSSEERTYTGDGVLLSSKKTEGDQTTVSEYRDGALWKETCWENGELVLTDLIGDGERRRTLYEFGEPYAVVVYDSRNGKIKKVEYL